MRRSGHVRPSSSFRRRIGSHVVTSTTLAFEEHASQQREPSRSAPCRTRISIWHPRKVSGCVRTGSRARISAGHRLGHVDSSSPPTSSSPSNKVPNTLPRGDRHVQGLVGHVETVSEHPSSDGSRTARGNTLHDWWHYPAGPQRALPTSRWYRRGDHAYTRPERL